MYNCPVLSCTLVYSSRQNVCRRNVCRRSVVYEMSVDELSWNRSQWCRSRTFWRYRFGEGRLAPVSRFQITPQFRLPPAVADPEFGNGILEKGLSLRNISQRKELISLNVSH